MWCCLLKVVIVEGWGREWRQPLLCPQGGVSLLAACRETLPGELIISLPCVSGVFQIAVFMLSVSGLFAFSPGTALCALDSSPAKAADL